MSKQSGSQNSPQPDDEMYEVFIRPRAGLSHRHVGSLRAANHEMALQNARDCYTRRREGVSIWVVPSRLISASQPEDKGAIFDPATDKMFRHPDFYNVPDDVEYI